MFLLWHSILVSLRLGCKRVVSRDGRNLLRIDLIVQSAVPASVAPYLVFRLDLRYALGNIRDAEGNATTAPDWRVLSTPVIGLTMSPTAVAGDTFRQTGVEAVNQVRHPANTWSSDRGDFSDSAWTSSHGCPLDQSRSPRQESFCQRNRLAES